MSVVIPVRNGASTVGAQLDALARADAPATVRGVVVDNGSTDDTVAVAESFADRPPVRVVDAPDATGPGEVRNVGARDARGDWLLFRDADPDVSY